MSPFLIYGLIDPRTLLVRYVGMSSSGMKRPGQHRSRSSSLNTHRDKWIRSLHDAEMDFEIVVLDEVLTLDQLQPAERWWISFFGREDLGIGDLTNHTDGGEGILNPSASIREKIAASKRGKPRDAATRAKLSAANLGKTPSSETIAKRSAALKGRVFTNEWRAKISAAKMGHAVSDETRAKIAVTKRLRSVRSGVRFLMTEFSVGDRPGT